MKNYPVSRKDNLVVQEMDREILIYDLNDNKAFCLNETSMLIWQACDGEKSTAEISQIISKKLNTPANEDLVWLALDQLKKENLIENGNQLRNNFAGMSRREVIKKVGLGTMIALPIIASIGAPKAIYAQSTCPDNISDLSMCSCTDAENGAPGMSVGDECIPGGGLGNMCSSPICMTYYAEMGNANCYCG